MKQTEEEKESVLRTETLMPQAPQQPEETSGNLLGIEERLVVELRQRRESGVRKYGVGVERTDLNRRQWLQHAKEEALDLAVYLERLLMEEARL